ncbi:MAG: DNA-binding protein [Planctomycetes bacterium]|nr:DNA-binding protein [Planctomycetota bacterium]
MKTTVLDREIRSRVDSFVTELTNVVRVNTLQAVHDALGAELGVAPAKRGPGRPRKSGTPSPIAETSSSAAPKAARKRRGGKRSSEDVLDLASTVLAYIKSHAGERLEQIGKGLGIATKELKLPVQKLFDQKAIKTKGKKRGTTYFAK